MDINDLKRKIKAQRLLSLDVGKVRVDLVIPSDFDVQVQAVKSGLGNKNKPESMIVFKRAICEASIVGWSNLTVGYLTGENDSDEVEFDQQLIVDFLDADKKNAETLQDALLQKIFEKRDLADSAKKN